MTAVAVDLFAGAGGWSHGWRTATGVEPAIAIDHCPHAVELHRLNHPSTEHFLEDVRAVDPAAAVAGRRVDWLHLSPDCTHFSRAKGGKPRDQGIRGLAWVGVNWARVARPEWLSLENVPEFASWGPLSSRGQPIKARAGETFREFVQQLRDLGYAVEWRVLCAADFGAPTVRRRLFLLARRGGGAITWPEPTHGAGRPLPWRTAAECIDWAVPCPSIFERKRPLAAATCRRIAAGIVRYVLQGQPFVVRQSIAGGATHAPVAAFLAKHYGGVVGHSLRRPIGTVTATDHHSLVAATVDRAGGAKARQVAAFLTTYYSQGGTANGVGVPMPAVVTKARHGLVEVELEGERHVVVDIGMRMLTPRELARAQGFPDSYVLEGSKADQIARIGNSVVPQVAAAIVNANLAGGAS